jgi:uncharacterized protein
MRFDARLLIATIVMVTVLTLLNLLVLRRVTAAFGLSPRGRRAVAIALGVPLLGTVFFRGAGAWMPADFARSAAAAVSAAELGVFIAASFLGLGALLSGATKRIRRLVAAEVSPAAGGEDPARAIALGIAGDEPTRAQNGSMASGNGPSGTGDGSSGAGDGASAAGDGAHGTIRVSAQPEGTPRPRADRPAPEPTAPDGAAPALTRRLFVEQAAVGSALLVGGGSAAYGGLFGRHDYELSTVPVPIPGLSKAADGFTIVQLSDIHLGQMIGEAQMRAAEELVRKARGDLIVLTGDLVDHDVRYTAHLGRLVRRLSEIRPVVAIPGNHDYYTGIDEVLATLRGAGATTLVNQATVMLGERGGFVLAGLDDPWGPRNQARTDGIGRGPDLAAALAGVRSDGPRIVLCHNPSVFVETAGQVELQISGHTHGGQVNLGVRPADYVLRHGYIAGLYETKGSRVYVNRGFGTAGPAVRVGAPPEVSRIVLVSA